MASSLPPAYQNVDFAQWSSWPTVIIGGRPYRQIPGQPVDGNGRPYDVYDPTSHQIMQNGEIYRDEAQEFQDSQTPGIAEQLLPVAGGTLGTVGAAYGVNQIMGSGGAGLLGSGAAAAPAAAAAPVAAAPIAANGAGIIGSGIGATGGAAAAPATAGAVGTGSTILGSSNLATALPIAGIGLGGYQAFKGFEKGDPVRGGLGGAGAGASAGFLLGGPVGAAIGGGLGLLSGVAGGFLGHEPQTNVEEKRLRKLQEKGIQTVIAAPEDDWKWDGRAAEATKTGQEKDFVGYAPDGRWTNNRFLWSRDKASLYTQDTQGYAVWSEELGNTYANMSPEQRSKVNAYALEHGLVSEGKGTLNISGNREIEDAWHAYSQLVASGQDNPAEDHRSKWDYDLAKQVTAGGVTPPAAPVQAPPVQQPQYQPVNQVRKVAGMDQVARSPVIARR